MAKFHLDGKGHPAACSATKRVCPLGGEHYETQEEALKASMAKAMAKQEPKPDDQDKLSPEFFQKVEKFDACFYTDLETVRNNGVSPDGPLLHKIATRSATKAGMNDYEKIVATNALTQRHWKKDLYHRPEATKVETPAPVEPQVEPKPRMSDNLDPRHYYGPWRGKANLDGVEAPAPREKQGPKPIDPEFIEALQMMYLKKFGVHPDEDGVDVGQLLAMFNKGELN